MGNEVALSEDLNVITAEINSYKQVAGQAIFEIGRRLKHVKENDLVHGEWQKYCEETLEISRAYANRYIKVYEEFGESNMDVYSHLGVGALYLIATLPQEEREKEHVTITGEVKTVDRMTVLEIQEIKKNLRGKNPVSSGELYIVKHKGFRGYYKIGITNNIKGRIKAFETTSPLGIKKIYSNEVDSTRALETIIHNKYDKQRRNGEWFEFDDKELDGVIEYIDNLVGVV